MLGSQVGGFGGCRLGQDSSPWFCWVSDSLAVAETTMAMRVAQRQSRPSSTEAAAERMEPHGGSGEQLQAGAQPSRVVAVFRRSASPS